MNKLLIPLLLLLSACDNPTPPPKTDITERVPNPVFETQIQAMKKAQAVEGQVNAAAEAQRKQLEQTERP